MYATAKLWGNSLALRIPAALARQMRLEAGARVELTVHDDTLCVRAIQEPFPTLGELLAQITPENWHAEYDRGQPAEREAW